MSYPHLHALTSLKPAGTNSFRLSSGQFLGRYGANLQNPDKEAMEIYIAPRGYMFVQPDQSGAEALVVAYLAKPGKYRELFNCGIKPHTFVAMHVFIDQYATKWPLGVLTPAQWKSLSPSQLKAHPDWPALKAAIEDCGKPYKIGKMICHASSYRMRERTFQLQSLKQSEGKLVLSLDECRLFLQFFRELFPEIVEWQDEIEFLLRRNRILYNLFGYPRRFERLINDSYVREGISWIPQSTVGCITHHGVRAYNNGKKPTWLLAVNNKHDSFLPIIPVEDVREGAEFAQSCMARKLVGRDGVEFTMKSSTEVGFNWAAYDKDTNPRGMRKLEAYLKSLAN